jgi:hypothetical protein
VEPKGIEPYAHSHISAEKLQGLNSGAPKASPTLCPPMVADAELQAVIEAWPALPEPIRVGILAMVRASGVAVCRHENQDYPKG